MRDGLVAEAFLRVPSVNKFRAKHIAFSRHMSKAT